MKGEKIIMDKFHHFIREKYDPLTKSALEDYKGERLASELVILKQKEQSDVDNFTKLMDMHRSKVQKMIQKRSQSVIFSFIHNKRGGLDELALEIFISLMELKGYEVERTEIVDTDRFLDYYEPFTRYKILLV
jgi:DUF1009 family protein